MAEQFEIRIIQGGVVVKREIGQDPFQVQLKAAGFIRRKYGGDPRS